MFQPIITAGEEIRAKEGPSSWQVSSVGLNPHHSANTLNLYPPALPTPPNFSHPIPYL